MGHLRLAQDADLVVVAPATADLLAKMAAGIADDLASTALLATDRPILVAPAMNTRMWENRGDAGQSRPARGARRAPRRPQCRTARRGRDRHRPHGRAARDRRRDRGAVRAARALEGRRALVTSGPTHEPIDPVRFIANRSSGQAGPCHRRRAGAQRRRHGAGVGPDGRARSAGRAGGAGRHRARDAGACEAALPADIAVCAAAVADWRAEEAPQKIKKKGAPPALRLVENPDILATLSARRQPPAAPGRRLRRRDREPGRQRQGQARQERLRLDPRQRRLGRGRHVRRRRATPSTSSSHDGVEDWPPLTKRDVARAAGRAHRRFLRRQGRRGMSALAVPVQILPHGDGPAAARLCHGGQRRGRSGRGGRGAAGAAARRARRWCRPASRWPCPTGSRRRCGRARAWRCGTGVTVLNSPGTIDSDYRGEIRRDPRQSRQRACHDRARRAHRPARRRAGAAGANGRRSTSLPPSARGAARLRVDAG